MGKGRGTRIICLAVWFLLLLTGCQVEPLADRTLPNVGTTYTGSVGGVKDLTIDPDVTTSDIDLADVGIESSEPSSGSPVGEEIIFVYGWGFTKHVEVYFDEIPAKDVFYMNSKKLMVTTPKHALGQSDITVWWPEGQIKTLPSGFLFLTELAVDDLEPDSGPMVGGTPITITGSGFTAGTNIVFGDRLAINIEVVTENTIYAVTPPGSSGGLVAVHASNVTGTATRKSGFTYTVVPRLDKVTPAVGPVAGGGTAVLKGKWLSPVTEVFFDSEAASVLEVKNDAITVEVPPGKAGHADVIATGSWGWDKLDDGYFYLESDSDPEAIAALVPKFGPEAGGNQVLLVGCGLVDGGLEAVWFGVMEAPIKEVLEEQCVVVVTAPAGTGVVDVEAEKINGSILATAAYSYQPEITVTSIEPNTGPKEGGTAVTITGTHFSAAAQVLIGPLPAGEVTFVDENTLEVTTPPGSPGPADVTVVSQDGTARYSMGFLYTVDSPEVYVITPNYGARAGGTFVQVIGAGFPVGSNLFVGSAVAENIHVKTYGLIEGYTPPNDVGTYHVLVSTSQGDAMLDNSYSYFNPISNYGGTWGAPVDGAVNVTVLSAGDWSPLEEAFVILGADSDTPHRGRTDENGQIVLAGPGLKGPVDAHATKKEHDAASFIHFDAENATLYLIPKNPPSTGEPGEPPEPPEPGDVSGRVIGLGKYVVIPPGNCLNKQAGMHNLCLPCITSNQCGAGSECMPMGKSGKFCTYGCGDTGDSCPEGYVCAPLDEQGYHCLPAAGKRTAKCELTRSSIYSISLPGNDEAMVDEEDRFHIPDTRLGEVAVVCTGGWTDADSGEYHPVAMGVKRHVNMIPGAVLEDQNIWLNIQLNRSLRVRLDDPPAFNSYGGVYRLTTFLDFGSDGVYKLPNFFEAYQPEDVVLTNLPAQLTGDIFDARYVFYTGAYSNTEDNTPYSVVYLNDVTDINNTSGALLEEDGFRALEGWPSLSFHSAWTTEKGTYLVGEDGAVFFFNDGSIYQHPVVTSEDLTDIYGFQDGSLVAVGHGGTVVRREGSTWILVGRVTDMDLRGVWGSDPDDIHAVGAHRIVSYHGGEWHELKVSYDLHDVWGASPDQVWAVGTGGAMLSYDGTDWTPYDSPTDQTLRAVRSFADGQLLVAGAGLAWIQWGDQWVDLQLAPDFTARGIYGVTASDFYLTGTAGLVAHWTDDGGWEYIAAPGNLQVNALVQAQSGELYAVGSPALLLTPFIPFQQFVHPADYGPWEQLMMDWWHNGETSPLDLHTVSITEKYGSSLWRFVVDGKVTHIDMPDFLSLIGVKPVIAGEKRVRIYSAHSPGFDIDNFDYTDMGTLSWKSWAYDMIVVDPEVE